MNKQFKNCGTNQIDYKSILNNPYYTDKVPKELLNKFLIMYFKNIYLAKTFNLFFFYSEEYIIHFRYINNKYEKINYVSFINKHINLNYLGYKYTIL